MQGPMFPQRQPPQVPWSRWVPVWCPRTRCQMPRRRPRLRRLSRPRSSPTPDGENGAQLFPVEFWENPAKLPKLTPEIFGFRDRFQPSAKNAGSSSTSKLGWLPCQHGSFFACFFVTKIQVSERKRTIMTRNMKYWLVNCDPYFMAYYNP